MWCSVCEALMKMSSLNWGCSRFERGCGGTLTCSNTLPEVQQRRDLHKVTSSLHRSLQTTDSRWVADVTRCPPPPPMLLKRPPHIPQAGFPFAAAAAVTSQYYTEQCYWSLLYEAAELLYFPEFERNYIIVRNLKTQAVMRQLPTNVLVSADSSFSVHTFKDVSSDDEWMNSIASCRDSSVEIGCWVTLGMKVPMGLCSATFCFSYLWSPPPPPTSPNPIHSSSFKKRRLQTFDFLHSD